MFLIKKSFLKNIFFCCVIPYKTLLFWFYELLKNSKVLFSNVSLFKKAKLIQSNSLISAYC